MNLIKLKRKFKHYVEKAIACTHVRADVMDTVLEAFLD